MSPFSSSSLRATYPPYPFPGKNGGRSSEGVRVSGQVGWGLDWGPTPKTPNGPPIAQNWGLPCGLWIGPYRQAGDWGLPVCGLPRAACCGSTSLLPDTPPISLGSLGSSYLTWLVSWERGTRHHTFCRGNHMDRKLDSWRINSWYMKSQIIIYLIAIYNILYSRNGIETLTVYYVNNRILW